MGVKRGAKPFAQAGTIGMRLAMLVDAETPVARFPDPRSTSMSLGAILLIVLVIAVIGSTPSWGYSRGWGYFPSGILGLILLIVIVLFALGRI